MKASVNSCQSSVERLEGSLADWLTAQLATAFATEQTWRLWVEPIAKTTQEKCLPYFIGTGKDGGKLSHVLKAKWQFKECYVFLCGKTIHGLSTEQGSYIRTITPNAADTPAPVNQTQRPQKMLPQRTPYLRQDLSRFDLSLEDFDLAAAQDFDKQSLTFNTFYCQATEQMEYILTASHSGRKP